MDTKVDDAVNRFQKKEQRYNILKIFLILASLLITMSYIGYQANRAINEVKADNRKTRDYIGCIVHFFTEPDRAHKSIGDIDKCTIDHQPAAFSAPANNTDVSTPSLRVEPSTPTPAVHMASVQPPPPSQPETPPKEEPSILDKTTKPFVDSFNAILQSLTAIGG